jgi:hypothetical protein
VGWVSWGDPWSQHEVERISVGPGRGKVLWKADL